MKRNNPSTVKSGMTKKRRKEMAERLAVDLVDAWDMDDVVSYAVNRLEEYYLTCDAEALQEDYDSFYGDTEDTVNV